MADKDLDHIAEDYAKMSDLEFERVVTSDAQGIRPEVFDTIKHEIKKRNMNSELLKGAVAQNKEYTITELQERTLIWTLG